VALLQIVTTKKKKRKKQAADQEIHTGQKVEQGEIIVRQRGQRFHPGQDVYISKDHTLHAAIPGFVKFYQDPRGDHVGYRALSLRRQRMRKFVGVVADPNEWVMYSITFFL
jgi:large subunit ribosomal protein L27